MHGNEIELLQRRARNLLAELEHRLRRPPEERLAEAREEIEAAERELATNDPRSYNRLCLQARMALHELGKLAREEVVK